MHLPSNIIFHSPFLQVLKVLFTHGIELHPPDISFEDSPIYHCCRFGQTNILSYIVEMVPGILMKKTFGSIGISPQLEYADIWAGLTRASNTEGGLVIGKLFLKYRV